MSNPFPKRPDNLEPPGGNLYRPHPLMIDSGTFWRCAHHTTGFKAGMEWEGCEKCREEEPGLAARFEGDETDP